MHRPISELWISCLLEGRRILCSRRRQERDAEPQPVLRVLEEADDLTSRRGQPIRLRSLKGRPRQAIPRARRLRASHSGHR